MSATPVSRIAALLVTSVLLTAFSPIGAGAKPALWSKTSDYTRVWTADGCGYDPCDAEAIADPATGAATVHARSGPEFGWGHAEAEFIDESASLPQPMPFVWVVATMRVDAVTEVVGGATDASADLGLRMEAFINGCDLCWQRTYFPLASSESGPAPDRDEFHGDIVLPMLLFGNVGGDLTTEPIHIILSLRGAAEAEGDEPRPDASFAATMQLQRLELVEPKYARETGPDRGGNLTLTATPPWQSLEAHSDCVATSCPATTADGATGALDLHAYSGGTGTSELAHADAYLNHAVEIPVAFDSILLRFHVHYDDAFVVAAPNDSGVAETMFGAEHDGCSLVQTCYSYDQVTIVAGATSCSPCASPDPPVAIQGVDAVYELLFHERQRGDQRIGGPMAAGTLHLVEDFFLRADARDATGLPLIGGVGDGEDAHTQVQGRLERIEMVIHPVPWPLPYEETRAGKS